MIRESKCYFDRGKLAKYHDALDDFDQTARSAPYRSQANRLREIVLELMKRNSSETDGYDDEGHVAPRIQYLLYECGCILYQNPLRSCIESSAGHAAAKRRKL